MAALNKVASYFADEIRDGIAWVIIWKTGRSWHGYAATAKTGSGNRNRRALDNWQPETSASPYSCPAHRGTLRGMRRVRAGMECKQRLDPAVVRLSLPAV